jgi:hypothetical protein
MRWNKTHTGGGTGMSVHDEGCNYRGNQGGVES